MESDKEVEELIDIIQISKISLANDDVNYEEIKELAEELIKAGYRKERLQNLDGDRVAKVIDNYLEEPKNPKEILNPGYSDVPGISKAICSTFGTAKEKAVEWPKEILHSDVCRIVFSNSTWCECGATSANRMLDKCIKAYEESRK